MKTYRRYGTEGLILTAVVLLGLVAGVLAADESGAAATDGAGGSKLLHVYLPRQVAIDSDELTLGRIGLIEAGHSLSERAAQVSLGRFSVAGQKATIDRQTILCRFAAEGIKPSGVMLTGSETVVVSRREKVITGTEMVKAAESFLRGQQQFRSAVSFEPVGQPKDLVLGDMYSCAALETRLVQEDCASKPKVTVSAVHEGKNLGSREIVFNVGYDNRRAVAITDIAAGAVLDTANTKTETFRSSMPEVPGWKEPYSLYANRTIRKGTVINENLAGPAAAPVLVKRKQQVVMKIDTDALAISASGEAMEDGRTGQYIRVKRNGENDDQPRIVVGMVKSDGTVEPVR